MLLFFHGLGVSKVQLNQQLPRSKVPRGVRVLAISLILCRTVCVSRSVHTDIYRLYVIIVDDSNAFEAFHVSFCLLGAQ